MPLTHDLTRFNPLRRRRELSASRRRYTRMQHATAVEHLERRELLAAQMVSAADVQVDPGTAFSIDVNYEATDNGGTIGEQLGGLLLRTHYDSSKLTFVDATNTLAEGFVAVEDFADTANAGGDAATDRLVQALWIDAAAQWPAAAQPVRLFTANFTAAANLSDTSTVRFTAETSPGITFDSTPVLVSLNPLTTPQLTAPTGNHANGQPEFTWNAVAGATTYDLWVNNRTTGQREVIRETALTGTSFTPASALGPGSYRGWLRAENASGSSGWSNVVQFTVGDPVPGQATLTAPTGTIADPSPTFTWDAVAGATEYTLHVNNMTTRTAAVILESGLTTTSFMSGTPLTPGSYRGWVRASNATGPGAWSDAVHFTVALPVPGKLRFTAPTGSTQSVRPLIEWDADPVATGYDLWVDNWTDGVRQVIREQQLSTNSFTPAQDLTPGVYSAWVRAFNDNGRSPWSERHDFLVGDTAPRWTSLSAPTGTNAPARPEFVWATSAGATKYDLWVNNRTTGQTQVIRQSDLTGTTFTPGVDLPAGEYSAWIRAGNDTGWSAWSRVWNFQVAVAPPRRRRSAGLRL